MKIEMKTYVILIALLFCTGLRAQEQPADSLGVEPAVTIPVAAAGETNDALWDRANTAYINTDYHTAIEVYNQILGRGEASAKLYYNMGNAYFKENQLGLAILYYKRAQRLSPGNDDIRYNLSVAEARTKDNIEEIPAFFLTTWIRALGHMMGCTAWSIVSLVALVLMLCSILFYLLSARLRLRKAGFFAGMLTLLLFVTATWFAAIERREILRTDEAVVVVPSTAVKSSPDRSATDLFLLHEGTPVVITASLDNWCEVMIADGKKGWLENKKIETI